MLLKDKAKYAWANLKARFKDIFEGGNADTFSPSLLEIQSSPPAPLSRSIACSITIAMVVFLFWSVWAEFDITITSAGNAIPTDKTKIVQSMEVARVTAIHIKDGDEVEQGQRLIELDATLAVSDHQKFAQDKRDAQLDVLRLEAQLKDEIDFSGSLTEASLPVIERQKHLLQSRVLEQRQKMAVLAQEIARKSADVLTAQANIRKIEDALPLLQQRLSMREKLWQEGFMAEVSVIESRLEFSSQAHELDVYRERLKEAVFAHKAAEKTSAQSNAEYKARISAELTEAHRRIQTNQQEIVKASFKESYQTLIAPISGTVQQLSVNTIGGVVNASQGLLIVVPKEGGIEVAAQVMNKDIGFLRLGLPVAVKLDAFDFTKYGSLSGELQWIGADALKDEKLGLVFPLRIILHDTRLPVSVNGEHPALRIGMSVTADIAIGKRKAYEYFLGPLLKYKNESLREP